MKTMYVCLKTIDDVKDFVNIVSRMEGDITLSGGRYIIDAKSIMGIFSLDLTKPLKLDIDEWQDEYAELLEKYCV